MLSIYLKYELIRLKTRHSCHTSFKRNINIFIRMLDSEYIITFFMEGEYTWTMLREEEDEGSTRNPLYQGEAVSC